MEFNSEWSTLHEIFLSTFLTFLQLVENITFRIK